MVYYLCGLPAFVDCSLKNSCVRSIIHNNARDLLGIYTDSHFVFFENKTFRKVYEYSLPEDWVSGYGGILAVCWKPDGRHLVFSTSEGYIFHFIINYTDSKGHSSSYWESPDHHCSLKNFSVHFDTQPPDDFGTCLIRLCSCGDLLVGASIDGRLVIVPWEDFTKKSYFPLTETPFFHDIEHSRALGVSDPGVYCRELSWAPNLSGIMTILSSGDIALLRLPTLDNDQKTVEGIWAQRLENPVSICVNDRFRAVAVGTRSSEVALYRIDETTGAIFVLHHLQISSHEYPDAKSLVGSVSQVVWSPDGYALAVVWEKCGWALWSVFGGLLYTSLGERADLADRLRLSHLSWSPNGCSIVGLVSMTPSGSKNLTKKTHSDASLRSDLPSPQDLTSESDGIPVSDKMATNTPDSTLAVFSLAHSALTSNPTSDNHRHIVLQTDERVIFCNRAQLMVARAPQTLLLPSLYIRHSWPICYVAVNTIGDRIAVAGARGFLHYNCLTQRWQMFGNEVQEQAIRVKGGLVWWKQYICFCCLLLHSGDYEVRAYPCAEKLDDQFASHCTLPTKASPVLVDCYENLFMLLTDNACVYLFSLSEKSGRKKSPVSLSAFQTIDLSALILFPSCVVRLCLSSVTASLPSRPRSKTELQSASNPKRPSLHISKEKNSRGSSWQDSMSHTRMEDTSCRDGPLSMIPSFLINYAGHLFILQTADPSDLGPTDWSNDERYGDKAQPLFVMPYLIASGVEIVWSALDTTCSRSPDWKSQLDREDIRSSSDQLFPYIGGSLWLYCGASGIQIWLPLPQLNLFSPQTFYGNKQNVSGIPSSFVQNMDTHQYSSCGQDYADLIPGYISRRIMLSVELEECIHPLAILFHQALLVSILNDFHQSLNASIPFGQDETVEQSSSNHFYSILPYGSIQIESHAFLHRLIQQLLRKNLGAHALQLCSAYQNLPHFHRVLEWLLHEVLEAEATSKSPIPDPLLPQVVAFIQEFPYFLETVAQCARKTEVARWPHLFTAVGHRPKDLFDLCIESGNFQTAASYLIILQSSEPASLSQEYTLHLIQTSINAGRWGLVRDLLRFLNAIDPFDLKSTRSMSMDSSYLSGGMSAPCIMPGDPLIASNEYQIGAKPRGLQQHAVQRLTVKADKNPTPKFDSSDAHPSTATRNRSGTTETNTDPERELSSLSLSGKVTKSGQNSLSDQVRQLITRMASNLFCQGKLKHMAELVVNLSGFLASTTKSSDVLAEYIASQRSDHHKVMDWPASLSSLHAQFNWPLPSTSDGDSAFAFNTDGGRRNSVRLFAGRSKHVLRQLRFLLSQLLQANSFEWACLVALMVLDTAGLFHAVTLAVDAATHHNLSRLRGQNNWPTSVTTSDGKAVRLWRRVIGKNSERSRSSNSTSVVDSGDLDLISAPNSPIFGDPLSRVLAGLNEIGKWALHNCRTYHAFLFSVQPELDQLVEQATSFFSQCASGSVSDPDVPVPVAPCPGDDAVIRRSQDLAQSVSVAEATPLLLRSVSTEQSVHPQHVHLVADNSWKHDPTNDLENSSSETQSTLCTNSVHPEFASLRQSDVLSSTTSTVEVTSPHSPSSLVSVGRLTASVPSSPVLWRSEISKGLWSNTVQVSPTENKDKNATFILTTRRNEMDFADASDHLVDGTNELPLHQASHPYSRGCILS
ncbi:unnamed protein product [Calicophoron daubneyi]|uniref:Protein RIC1 homolog n=1 Tax=Calicophoron daubneyi TaxID=300641 RepID=A0AAV2T5I7_CALDB